MGLYSAGGGGFVCAWALLARAFATDAAVDPRSRATGRAVGAGSPSTFALGGAQPVLDGPQGC